MRVLADEAIEDLTGVQDQLPPLVERLDGEGERAITVRDAAQAAYDALERIRLELVAEPGGYRSPAMLRARIAELLNVVAGVSEPPTTQQSEWIERFDGQLVDVVQRVRAIIDEEIADINRRVADLGLPVVTTPERGRMVS